MQIFPVVLMALIGRLPESPRFFIYHDREDEAKKSMEEIYGKEESKEQFKQLKESHENEPDANISYADMLSPSHDQFHPTVLTIMAQVNQALTGYGAISVYGPQIFAVSNFILPLAPRAHNANLSTAPRLQHNNLRIHNPRKLHFLSPPHDFLLAPH